MGWLPARHLLKRPGTSALAVVALALGIGLTTTMFGIVHGVLLRGLPFERGDRILAIGDYPRRQGGSPPPRGLRVADYLDVAGAQRSFEEVAASFSGDERGDIVGPDGIPLRYEAASLTPNALRVLRVQPIRGRGFEERDALPGAERVVLIGETIWMTQFQGDPAIVGKVIRANGEPATIVGVMPAVFGFPEHQRVWFPLVLSATADRSPDAQSIDAFGRLRDGVSIKDAGIDLNAIAERLEAAYPENKDKGIGAVPYVSRHLPGPMSALLWSMLAAVFGVLLIACVNVANLQLARSADRTREIAIRLSLGATRARLVWDQLIEGLLIAAIGTAVGILIARASLPLLWRSVGDSTSPFWIRFDVDPTVVIFATSLMVFAAVASSVVPALRATRGAAQDVLKDGDRAATGLRLGRFSRSLVVFQIALSFGLLMVSGLVIKSIVNASTASLPFRTDVLSARLDLRGPEYKTDDALRSVVDRIQERATAIPGAAAVTFSVGVPGANFELIEVDGQPLPADSRSQPRSEVIAVADNYLQVMQLAVTSGRGLLPSDRHGNDLVAVVSDDFAVRYFPQASPLGQRIRIGRAAKGAPPPPWRTIVGTIPRIGNLSGQTRPYAAVALVPFDQRPGRAVDVIVAGTSGHIVSGLDLRRAVADIDDRIVVHRLRTLADHYEERVWVYRTFGGLFSAFGVAALLLASAGLYGVMAFTVRRRTAEIGIRMAIGADRSRILWLILRQAITLLAVGIFLGAGLGVFLSAQITDLFYNVELSDPSVLITTFGVLVVSGLAAAVIPARRAASSDPLVALRSD
jgi:putative ABC transport system permease protein